MINEQCNSSALARIDFFSGLSSLLHKLMIEFDKEECLVLHSSEQIVISNEIEDVGPAQAQKVWQGLPRLAVRGIANRKASMLDTGLCRCYTYSSARHSMRITESGVAALVEEEEGSRSSSA